MYIEKSPVIYKNEIYKVEINDYTFRGILPKIIIKKMINFLGIFFYKTILNRYLSPFEDSKWFEDKWEGKYIELIEFAIKNYMEGEIAEDKYSKEMEQSINKLNKWDGIIKYNE